MFCNYVFRVLGMYGTLSFRGWRCEFHGRVLRVVSIKLKWAAIELYAESC